MRKSTCVLLGALACISCVSLFGCSNEKAANALKDAIYLDKPVINSANEGKLVIIHGYAKMTKGAEDPEMGLRFDSPVVTRAVQTLEAQKKTTTNTQTTTSADGKKVEKKETKTSTAYEWRDTNVKDNKHLIRTETFTGEAKLGDFILTGNSLKYIFNNKDITVTREMANRARMFYWKQGISKPFMTTRRISDRFMMSNSEKIPANEGIARVSYIGKEKDSKNEYTYAGYQQNGRLVSTKDFTIQYYAGNLSKEEMIAKNK